MSTIRIICKQNNYVGPKIYWQNIRRQTPSLSTIICWYQLRELVARVDKYKFLARHSLLNLKSPRSPLGRANDIAPVAHAVRSNAAGRGQGGHQKNSNINKSESKYSQITNHYINWSLLTTQIEKSQQSRMVITYYEISQQITIILMCRASKNNVISILDVR